MLAKALSSKCLYPTASARRDQVHRNIRPQWQELLETTIYLPPEMSTYTQIPLQFIPSFLCSMPIVKALRVASSRRLQMMPLSMAPPVLLAVEILLSKGPRMCSNGPRMILQVVEN